MRRVIPLAPTLLAGGLQTCQQEGLPLGDRQSADRSGLDMCKKSRASKNPIGARNRSSSCRMTISRCSSPTVHHWLLFSVGPPTRHLTGPASSGRGQLSPAIVFMHKTHVHCEVRRRTVAVEEGVSTCLVDQTRLLEPTEAGSEGGRATRPESDIRFRCLVGNWKGKAEHGARRGSGSGK